MRDMTALCAQPKSARQSENSGIEQPSQSQIFDEKFETVPETRREQLDGGEGDLKKNDSRIPESLHEKQTS